MIMIISATFLLGSLIGIAIIAGRHWPQLESLDIETLPQTRDAQTKNTILEERLKRKLIALFEDVWEHVRPLLTRVKNLVRQWYHFLLEKERQLRERSEKMLFHEKAHHEQKEVIDNKLKEIKAAAEKSKDESITEEKYLEILSLDPKNIEAYEGLADLYYKQKDYKHAREVYEFILKMNGDSAEYLIDVALCHKADEDQISAFKTLEKALKLEPKNPKIIDMLVDTAIIMKDRVMAKHYLKVLREVNPENKKIEDLKETIESL